MKIELTPLEARVIGCLIEKEITTPEQYPLSLNALTGACNQKTNRDPVLELDEREVQAIVDSLVKRFLVSDKGGYGGRTTKYRHRFCNTEFGPLQFAPRELGIVCTLLLRGPQTPGELRTRTQRLCEFTDVAAVETTLAHLMARDDGPFVARLPRAPGERESRYAHLFSGHIESVAAPAAAAHVADEAGLAARIEKLESMVATLQAELAACREMAARRDDRASG